MKALKNKQFRTRGQGKVRMHRKKADVQNQVSVFLIGCNNSSLVALLSILEKIKKIKESVLKIIQVVILTVNL